MTIEEKLKLKPYDFKYKKDDITILKECFINDLSVRIYTTKGK